VQEVVHVEHADVVHAGAQVARAHAEGLRGGALPYSPSAVQLEGCTFATALMCCSADGLPARRLNFRGVLKAPDSRLFLRSRLCWPVAVRAWRPPNPALKPRCFCSTGHLERAEPLRTCAPLQDSTGPAGLRARLRPLGVLLRAEREVLLQQRGEGAGAHQQHRVAAAAAVERHAQALAPVAVVRREQQLRARRAALACRSEPADGRSDALASCPPALEHGGAALLVAGASSFARIQISLHGGPCRVLGPPHAPPDAPTGRACARCANRSQAAAAPAGPC